VPAAALDRKLTAQLPSPAFSAALARCAEIQAIVERACEKSGLTLRKGKGVPTKLARVTDTDIKVCQELMLLGVTPQIAACRAFRIHPVTFNKWMDEGRKTDAPPVQQAFYFAMRDAALVARMVCESRVFEENPEAWLMRGPGGRTQPDEPGE
jgi:hypothetical protein